MLMLLTVLLERRMYVFVSLLNMCCKARSLRCVAFVPILQCELLSTLDLHGCGVLLWVSAILQTFLLLREERALMRKHPCSSALARGCPRCALHLPPSLEVDVHGRGTIDIVQCGLTRALCLHHEGLKDFYVRGVVNLAIHSVPSVL